MAFKRRRMGPAHRPMRTKRRRMFRRRATVTRSVFPKTHSFRRTCSTRAVTGDGVATTQYFGFNFALSDLPNAGEFSQLYDQYRFTGIKLKVGSLS